MPQTAYDSLFDFSMADIAPVEYPFGDGSVIYGFPSQSIDLFSIVLSYEAGSFYQDMYLQASAAAALFSHGTLKHTPQQVAEFIDYRGIIFKCQRDKYTSKLTVYMLHRYADEFLPLLHEMITQPLFEEREFTLYQSSMRNQILLQEKQTASRAYQLESEAIYGVGHPLSGFASVEDVDRLSLDAVKDFFARRFTTQSPTVAVAGSYDEKIINLCHTLFGGCRVGGPLVRCEVPPSPLATHQIHENMPSSQTSIHIARMLPIDILSKDAGRINVLNTLLGGYFSSRLMRNIREDKGYTYGIYSQLSLSRGDIIWNIQFDCGNAVVQQALDEIYHELDRLASERVPDDELNIVRRYKEGKFLRSIDGVFERCNQFMNTVAEGLPDEYTVNQNEAIVSTTPDDIQRLAQQYLRKDDLYEICVGDGVK